MIFTPNLMAVSQVNKLCNLKYCLKDLANESLYQHGLPEFKDVIDDGKSDLPRNTPSKPAR